MSNDVHSTTCHCAARSAPYAQTMDEMDFVRGIWSAAMSGEIDEVQKHLDKQCSLNQVDSAGYTALHYAARHGHSNVCKLLLQSGANPNCLTRAGKATPLHRAAYSGHSEVVKVLIEHGAKLDIVDIDGQTALHKSVQKANIEVIQLLMKKDPSLSTMKDKWNKLPVNYVVETNLELQLLLKPCPWTAS